MLLLLLIPLGLGSLGGWGESWGVVLWSKVRQIFRQSRKNQFEEGTGGVYIPNPDDYPTFFPLPPGDLLQDPIKQFDKIAARKFGGPRGEYKDNPLYALCRFYEFVALDRNPKNWKTSYSSGPDCQFLAYN